MNYNESKERDKGIAKKIPILVRKKQTTSKGIEVVPISPTCIFESISKIYIKGSDKNSCNTDVQFSLKIEMKSKFLSNNKYAHKIACHLVRVVLITVISRIHPRVSSREINHFFRHSKSTSDPLRTCTLHSRCLHTINICVNRCRIRSRPGMSISGSNGSHGPFTTRK